MRRFESRLGNSFDDIQVRLAKWTKVTSSSLVSLKRSGGTEFYPFVNTMTTEPLSTSDINYMLKHIKMFIGTFPSDIVPVYRKNHPQAFVINTAPDKTSGEHWTALILVDNKCLYFDSFGRQIRNIELLESLKRAGVKNYLYNSRQIQSVLSNSCGYYCVAFILSFVCGASYPSFMSNFVTKLKQNDDFCYRFIESVLNKQC